MTLATLRNLSPLGPIFGKELRVTARRRRTYVLRFLYLGVLLVVMLFFFLVAAEAFQRGTTSVVRQAQRLAEMGMVFFIVFSFFTLGSMALVGPVLTATAVNAERLHKTLPVLLMTPITAWQIVAGKLCSRLLIALTLIGLTLPALSVVRLLGGVETAQIVASLSLSASVVVAGAALGLLFSTLMNRAYAVILLSYGTMMLAYGLAPMFLGMTIAAAGSGRGGMPRGMLFFFQFLNLTNPFFTMGMTVTPAGVTAPFRIVPWYYCAGLHLAVASLLLLLSALILRRMARKEHDGGGVPTPALPPVGAVSRPADQATALEPPPMAFPPIPVAARGATVSDRPVLWRELRRPLLSRRWQAITAAIATVALLLLFYLLLAANNVLDDRDPQSGFACVFCGLLTLLACVISATAIAQEKESDTWTLLLASPLSATGIVLGKLGGLLRRLLWPSILIIAHFLLFALCGVITWTTAAVILYLTFTTNLVWIATGLYYSLRLKTVTFAVILNLCGPAVAYGLMAIITGILGIVMFDTDEAAEVVGVYAPYVHMVSAVDYLGSPRYQRADHNVWTPVFGYVSRDEFLAMVAVVGLAHVVLTALVVGFTIWQFNRTVGRADQRHRLC